MEVGLDKKQSWSLTDEAGRGDETFGIIFLFFLHQFITVVIVTIFTITIFLVTYRTKGR